jgi:ribonucleoside-triphosphate reductase (formate)
MNIIKRNGTTEIYNFEKIIEAIKKSANRINYKFSKKDYLKISTIINMELDGSDTIHVDYLHGLIEKTLFFISREVGESYSNYRNYKNQFGLTLLNSIEASVEKVLNDVDRSNSNSNTRLISTKRTDIAKAFSKELYQKIHLSIEEMQAAKDGYIYIHDFSDLILPQINCQLFDMKNVLNGGFEIENIKYTEPKNIKTAVSQMGDITLCATSQSFGGFTIPEVDKVLAPYYKKTIKTYKRYFRDLGLKKKRASHEAKKIAYDDLVQSLQGVEIKLNTVNSARGSFAFTTYSFGDCSNKYEAAIGKAILEVRLKGHGDEGFRKKLIFPKLVFIHNEDIHGDGRKYDWLFDLSINCSSQLMYPDYIGKGHKREGVTVSPMGRHI